MHAFGTEAYMFADGIKHLYFFIIMTDLKQFSTKSIICIIVNIEKICLEMAYLIKKYQFSPKRKALKSHKSTYIKSKFFKCSKLL